MKSLKCFKKNCKENHMFPRQNMVYVGTVWKWKSVIQNILFRNSYNRKPFYSIQLNASLSVEIKCPVKLEEVGDKCHTLNDFRTIILHAIPSLRGHWTSFRTSNGFPAQLPYVMSLVTPLCVLDQWSFSLDTDETFSFIDSFAMSFTSPLITIMTGLKITWLKSDTSKWLMET